MISETYPPQSTAVQREPVVEVPCAHCGLPTPSQAREIPEPVFCCQGCQGAYQLIRGWGLENYYSLRDQQSAVSTSPANDGSGRYAAFEDEAFLGQSKPVVQGDGLHSARFALHGLHCGACAWLIENAATRTPGWQLARVKMSDHTIRVVYDPRHIGLSRIARLLGRLGYEMLPLSGVRDDQFRLENRRLLAQIAVAGFFATNAMWIAVALYAGEAFGVESDHRAFLRWMGSGLGVAAVLFPGRTFFQGALASLRTRTPHMDLPVALGLSVGTVMGSVNAVTGRGDVYFDSLAVLVFLLLVGRWIQFHQQHRAARAIDLLLRITPQHARRIDDEGRTAWVLVDALRADDTIRVDAGESIPVDGRILRGTSTLDRSLLTGESVPVMAEAGDEVAAGTVNLMRSIEIRVEATGRESRIGKIMETVEAAMGEKAPVVQLADRIGGIFVIVVTLLAGGTLWAWSRTDWSVATAHATALLIVACPCALALATPLAIAVALGRAANQKLLIRDGAALQQLASPGMVWFDKTGTLSEGRARAEIVYGDSAAVPHAAAVEQGCCHPIAEAVQRLAAEQLPPKLATPELATTELATTKQGSSRLSGLDPSGCESGGLDPSGTTRVGLGGVSGESGGRRVDVGNLAFMQAVGVHLDGEVQRAADACLDSAASPILIALDGVAVTVLRMSDPLKREAGQLVAELKRRGWTVGILSGDHPSAVRHVAERLGIEPALALGGLSPEDKLRRVRERSRGTVVMIGDGANDAAALAAADVGVAVRGGAEVSLQAAPVFVASSSLAGVAQLFRGSTRTSWLIIAAFSVSLSYNVVAVGLAMAGKITPLTAAVLMPVSSISVLSITLLWPTFRESDG